MAGPHQREDIHIVCILWIWRKTIADLLSVTRVPAQQAEARELSRKGRFRFVGVIHDLGWIRRTAIQVKNE